MDDVNIVFTSSGLEKDPLTRPVKYEKDTFLDPRDALTENEESELHTIMQRLGECVRKHRIMFKTHFQDKVNIIKKWNFYENNRIKPKVVRFLSPDLDQF